MARLIVIIHDWSDHGITFKPTTAPLATALKTQVAEIGLAEWESTNG